MRVMPIWFYFLHFVVQIPYKMLERIQASINRFIFGFKKPRIKNEVLHYNIIDGGLAELNVTMYYQAATSVSNL